MPNPTSSIEVTWNGPYGWPTFESENNLRPIPRNPGVYLQTFRYQDGYLIYAAGITRRPVPTRFREHRGMQLAPLRDSEDPIIVKNNCAAVLHGLPAFLEI